MRSSVLLMLIIIFSFSIINESHCQWVERDALGGWVDYGIGNHSSTNYNSNSSRSSEADAEALTSFAIGIGRVFTGNTATPVYEGNTSWEDLQEKKNAKLIATTHAKGISKITFEIFGKTGTCYPAYKELRYNNITFIEKSENIYISESGQCIYHHESAWNHKFELCKAFQIDGTIGCYLPSLHSAIYGDNIYKGKFDGNIYLKKEIDGCFAIIDFKTNRFIYGRSNEEHKTILDHINRNKNNRKPNGNLTLIKKHSADIAHPGEAFAYEAYYMDKAGCIWILYRDEAAAYHNPKNNFKFCHYTNDGKSSHEVIIKKPSNYNGVLPSVIPNYSIVRKPEIEGTYNFNGRPTAIPHLLSTKNSHKGLDVNLHDDEGFQYYTNFGKYDFAEKNDNDIELKQILDRQKKREELDKRMNNTHKY
jgi:hypothetical protein